MEGTYELIEESPKLLVLRIVGTLSPVRVREFAEAIQRHLAETTDPVLLLVDVSQADVPTAQGRLYIIHLMRNAWLSGAYFGGPMYGHAAARIMTHAAGAAERWRFFDTEAEARAWLDGST